MMPIPPRLMAALACSLGACTAPAHFYQHPGAASLRGLSAVDAAHAWVAGSGGFVAFSTNRGRSWQSVAIPTEASNLDFRDVEAFSRQRVLLLAAGPGSQSAVWRSEDGGQHWWLCLRNNVEAGFWDGFAFWDEDRGLLVGDPVDGRLLVMLTEDGGQSWQLPDSANLPQTAEGEYAFAASGTSLAVAGKNRAWIATGGSVARIWRSVDGGQSWQPVAVPLAAGSPSRGCFSVAFRDSMHGVVVGGDYENPSQAGCVAAWTEDGGLHWHAADVMPGGYRSGVCWNVQSQCWVAVGPNGTDWSQDGRVWQPSIEQQTGFHAVVGAWRSGAQGRLLYSPRCN